MLRHPKWHYRCNDERLMRGDQTGGADRHFVGKPMVDHDRQMRAVLLGSTNRDDDDGVIVRALAKLVSAQSRPLNCSHGLSPVSWLRSKGRQRIHRHVEILPVQ